MISHKHKCIFIHISKCAGSTIEHAFGIDISDISKKNNSNLFGWNDSINRFLQHATPQELFDGGFIDQQIWENYYKFIIIRNPYSRALSDYIWMMKELKVKDSFRNFISMRGQFEKIKDTSSFKSFRADHLNKQRDYFFLNGKEINYDCVIRFENLSEGLNKVSKDLKLPEDFFHNKKNASKKVYKHYSMFYNKNRRKVLESEFLDDIEFLNYEYEEIENLKSIFKMWFFN